MSQWPQITLFQPNNSSIILLLIFGEKENSKIVLALEISEIKSGCLHFRHDDEMMNMILTKNEIELICIIYDKNSRGLSGA